MSDFCSTQPDLHSGSCQQGRLLPRATRILAWPGGSDMPQGEVSLACYLRNTSKGSAILEFEIPLFDAQCDGSHEERWRLEPGETRILLLGSYKTDPFHPPTVLLDNLGTDDASYECVLMAVRKKCNHSAI